MATEKQESRRWTGRVRRPGIRPWDQTNGMVQVRKIFISLFFDSAICRSHCNETAMHVAKFEVRIEERESCKATVDGQMSQYAT